ncbi:MAG: hypothetical protein HY815_18785, partial [Candidatus Riflebacteria bacterium]|nr:hypothetical protein [Candidatus Riflebacteria bacterium]
MNGTSRGFALAYGVIVIFIVVMILLAFTQFRTFVTHTTELTVQEVNAHAAAEAGLVAAIAELQANGGFRTHNKVSMTNQAEVRQNPTVTPKYAFEEPQDIRAETSQVIAKLSDYQSLGGIERLGTGQGDYSFKIGTGLGPSIGRGFEATFRVKVAPILLENATKRQILIESRGCFDQRAVAIQTLLEGGDAQPASGPGTTYQFDVRFPSFSSILNDFTIFDGDVVDVGMGSPSDSNNQNVYSFGRFYGHSAVHIGDIEGSGTRQAFKKFGGFQTGGTVWFASDYRVTFWDPTQASETSPELNLPAAAAAPAPDQNASKELFERSGGLIADVHQNGRLSI